MDERTGLFAQLIERHHYPGTQPWVIPAYGGQSVINLMHSLLRHYGVAVGASLDVHDAFEAVLHGRRKIFFLLVDGLGWVNLEGARIRPPVDALAARAARWPLTTMYPSTTSTVTASYLTGLPPSQHGILGFSMYLPEYAQPFNMLNLRSLERDEVSLTDLGFHPEQYIGHPTILKRLNDAGILARAYINERYAFNGLSRLTYHDCPPYSFAALGDLLGMALDQLSAPVPQFIFAYWSYPDSIAHVFGWHSSSYLNEVELLAATILGQVLPRLDDDTAMIICADHGHMDGNDAEAINLMTHTDLLRLFRVPPAGESTGLYLFLKPGTVPQAQTLLSHIEGLTVLTKEELLQVQLLGAPPYHPRLIEQVGDLLLLPHGTRRILYDYQHRPHTAMMGRHGGMTPEQMVVPMMVF